MLDYDDISEVEDAQKLKILFRMLVGEIDALNEKCKDNSIKVDGKMDETVRLLNQMSVEIGKLKVKAGIWGVLGGAIPAAIGVAIWVLKSLVEKG